MNRYQITRLCCLLWLLGYVFWAEAKETHIQGQILNYEKKELVVQYRGYGPLTGQEKVTLPVRSDGFFSYSFDTEEPILVYATINGGFMEERYTLQKEDGSDTTMTAQTNHQQLFYLYLEPGDTLSIEMNAHDLASTLRISGTHPENSRYLNAEEANFNRYADKVMKNYFGYVHYGPSKYTAYVRTRESARLAFFKKWRKKLSKTLAHVSELTIHEEAATALMNYPGMRKTYTNQAVSLPDDYFNFLDQVKLDKSDQLKGLGHYYFLDQFLKLRYRQEGSKGNFFEYASTYLRNQPLYEYYAWALGSNFRKELYDLFDATCPYPVLAAQVKAKYKHLEKMLAGNPAPELALEDTLGNQLELADLRGHYLYLDFWATWCGPCIQEIPSLEQLQKDYQGKNIRFVSISIDKEGDKMKWKTFVKTRNMKGKQLWVDQKNKEIVSAHFDIKQIPRFILLDPEGKIVDANAARPSDPAVRSLFDSVLK